MQCRLVETVHTTNTNTIYNAYRPKIRVDIGLSISAARPRRHGLGHSAPARSLRNTVGSQVCAGDFSVFLPDVLCKIHHF